MDWHILTMLPLLGLTNSWRGVRIGGKVIGGVGGLGASNNPAVQAFDKAKAAGDREGMERAARQLNEQRMERSRGEAKPVAKEKATPAKKSAPAGGGMAKSIETVAGQSFTPPGKNASLDEVVRSSRVLDNVDTRTIDTLWAGMRERGLSPTADSSKIRYNEYFRRMNNRIDKSASIIREMESAPKPLRRELMADLRRSTAEIRKQGETNKEVAAGLRDISSDVVSAAAARPLANPAFKRNPQGFVDSAATVYGNADKIANAYATRLERIAESLL